MLNSIKKCGHSFQLRFASGSTSMYLADLSFYDYVIHFYIHYSQFIWWFHLCQIFINFWTSYRSICLWNMITLQELLISYFNLTWMFSPSKSWFSLLLALLLLICIADIQLRSLSHVHYTWYIRQSSKITKYDLISVEIASTVSILL